MNSKKEYDMAMIGRGLTGLSLRIVVSGYIVYLAWNILTASHNGSSPIPDWASWLIFTVFVVAAVTFCLFAVRQFLNTRKAAQLSDASQQKNGEADIHESSETDETEK